jgi:hypothetical protein
MSEGTITERLMEAFPPEAIKEREGGGRRRLSYVEGHTVIHRLIKATGNRFDVRVLALEYKGDLLTATVELSIPELGTRQHIGVQKVSERGGEDLVKGAVTDAIKKAATLFGVGLELYGPDYESGEQTTPRAGTTPGREPAPRRSPQRPTPSDRPAAVPSAAGPPSPGKATAEELEELSAADFGWTEFWSWARQRGYSDRTSLDAAVGRSTQGMTPVEIRAALRKVVVPA